MGPYYQERWVDEILCPMTASSGFERDLRVVGQDESSLFAIPAEYWRIAEIEEANDEVIRLDRRVLEREGQVRFHSIGDSSLRMARPKLYCLRRWEEVFCPQTPRCLEILGLDPGVSKKDIKRAYRRLACEIHPDRGGTVEGFVELQTAYQAALRL